MSSHIIFEIITILNTRAHVITVEFDFFDERNIIHPSVFHQIVYVRRRSIFFYTFHFPLGQKNKHRETGVANVKSNGAEKSAVLVVVKRS